MKICGIICEYNPFHNGHLYQLSEAKKRSNADVLLCLMSGNFVQRGESAVCDKFTRAKHAVLAGADIVIELPTVFATSNAELFAKGAISILSSIPAVTSLCFGAEYENASAFLNAAKLLNNEPKEVSHKIKLYASQGMGYAKARAQAWSGLLPNELLSSPNNILGLEYTRAILAMNASIEILPVNRVGGGYKDTALTETFSSATAIRTALETHQDFSAFLPSFVNEDLPKQIENRLETLKKYALLTRSMEEIAKVCDCTEGLENALKKAAEKPERLEDSLTSARYTSARIRRIALQNLLQIEEDFIRKCLSHALYLRVLAVKKEKAEILSILSQASIPTIVRAHDENVLDEVSKTCFEKDLYAERVYSLLYQEKKGHSIFI